ncbi:hypothetical protein HpCK101_31530 [Helicobacter pylori]
MISNISITPIKNMLKSALNIHNFSFKSHTSTAIIGANGSGKSTLINTILGIREDYNVKVQNNNIPYHNNIIPQRKQLGVVSNLFNYPTWAKVQTTYSSSISFFIKLIIMDEPETSLEQNALIKLSNLIKLRNT